MGKLDKAKAMLPASSRSTHAMHEELGELHGQMGQMWAEVGHTRIMVMDMWSDLGAKLIGLEQQLKGIDGRMMLTFWEGYRKEGESMDDARERFFKTMGSARGGLRVFQLASAQLLSEFDAFCTKHGLTYAAVSGTILGAVRHQGFIPWDDDLDVGMPRADIERAIELVRDDPRYKITVRYDYNVFCKQVRFCYTDDTVPCFVDLFYYDMVKETGEETFNRREEAREALKAELAESEELSFWNEENPIVEADSDEGRLIAPYFERAVEQLYSPDGPMTYELDEAAGVILGIDNLDALVDHHEWYMVERDDILPMKRGPFEGHDISLPNHAWKCAEVHFGDLYELPGDIGIHFDHFSREILHNKEAFAKLEDLAQSKEE